MSFPNMTKLFELWTEEFASRMLHSTVLDKLSSVLTLKFKDMKALNLLWHMSDVILMCVCKCYCNEHQ